MSLPPISPSGVFTAFLYPVQTSKGSGYVGVTSANPGMVNAPIIFEPPSALTGGDLLVWIIATGQSANFGGCQVWASVDDTTYGQIGTILAGQIQGVLTALFPSGSDPDTTNTLMVDLSESAGQLIAGTTTDADDFVTLCYVDGELAAYSAATLTSLAHYSLGSYLRRGCYGSAIGAHASGSQFGRIIGSTFSQQFPANLAGKTVYFKFPAFNTFGAQLQPLSAATAYSYTLTGIGLEPPAWYQSFSVGGKFGDLVLDEWDGNYEIFDVQMPAAVTFPVNFATSPAPGCENAPGSNVTLTYQTIHAGTPTTVGTLTIANGATTGSFTLASPLTVPAGDRLRLYAPAAVDTAIAGLYGTIAGTR